MTEEMRKILNSTDKHIVVQAKAGCFPRGTQYFNGKKWKGLHEYSEVDKVLQYNENNFTGTLVKPINYIRRINDSGWYKLKLEYGSEIICSGSHDILYYDEEYKPHKCKPNDFKSGYILTPTNSYIGKVNSVFRKVVHVSKINNESHDNNLEYCFTVPSGNLILKQNGIVFTTGNCGKSSTMLEYVKLNTSKKILFLVYNREAKNDFSNRLKGIKHNCTVSTIHSLAYQWYLSQGFPKKSFRNINIVDIKQITGSGLEYKQLAKVKFYFEMFLTSNKDKPSDLETIVPEERVYLRYVDILWTYFRTRSDWMPHNVYLKLYQLAKIKLHHEVLIVDELNDVNEVMLDLITNNMHMKIITVGDSKQLINSFNFSTDGLNILEKDYGFKRYDLTNSFRVSEDVAKLSSRYLSYAYDEGIEFHGLGNTKIGKLDLSKATKDNQINLLCRTKLGGLKQISDVLDKDEDKKIYYVGGLEGFGIKEIERVLAYRGTIYIGGERFHINELRKMLKEGVDDSEIKRICSIYSFVEKNEDAIMLLKTSETKNREEADIIVLTSHASKGLTLTNVMLGKDFPSIEKSKSNYGVLKDKHSHIKGLCESELNLIYVALTRATGTLDINGCLNKDSSRKDTLDEVLEYTI